MPLADGLAVGRERHERGRVHAVVAERLGAIHRASRADVDYLAELAVAEAAAVGADVGVVSAGIGWSG
jgi:hypothetical protein